MMNRICILVIAFVLFIPTLSLANEQDTNAGVVATSETVASVPSYFDWYKEASQLENKSRRNLGHSERRNGLEPNVYSELRPDAYSALSQEERVVKAITWKEIKSNQVSMKHPIGWTQSTQVSTDDKCDKCEKCEKDCLCPPYVCKDDFCLKNYAIVFGAKWCHYCPQMYPVVEQLRREGYYVIYLDTDKFPKTADKFGLSVWPTTVVMDNGKEQVRFTGVTSIDSIKQYLTKTRKEQESKPEKIIEPQKDSTNYDLTGQ